METKAVISIVSSIIVLAAIAGAAYYFLFYVSGDEINTDFEVGDFVEYRVTTDGINSTLRHDVIAVNEDGTYEVKKTDGGTTTTKTMTKKEVKELISIPDSELSDFDKQTFTEKVSTPFGDFRCKLYSGKISGFEEKIWVGKDNVIYKLEVKDLMTMELKNTTFFD